MFDLPTYQPSVDPALVPPPAPARPGIIMGGLKSGGYGMLGALAGAGSGLAKIAGADETSAALGQKAQQFAADAQQVGRPDIDAQSWTGHGLGGFAQKAGYTLAQAIPQIGGAVLGGVAATAALPEEAAIAGAGGAVGALSRVGMALPSWLGGASEAAAGARVAAGIGGAAATMIPQSFGEQVNAAAEQPGGLTRGNAVQAAIQSVPVGLAQSVVPGEGAILRAGGKGVLGQLGGMLGSGALARTAEHGITNAAAGAIGAGAQTAAQLAFDPTISASDKAAQILHAAGQGAIGSGLIGGAFGGLFGGRHSAADVSGAVDEGLEKAGFPAAPPQLPAPNDTLRTMDGRIFDTTPRSRPETPLTEVQQPFNLQATPEAVHGPTDIQFNLFGHGPYDPGVAPVRTRAEAIEAVKAARAVAAGGPDAAGATEPTLKDILQPGPAEAPPNAFMRQAMEFAGLRKGRGTSDFGTIVDNSTATNPAELYNELAAIPPDAAVTSDKRFQALAERLGIGVPDLEGKLAAAKTPAERATLSYQINLRDAAAQLREQPAPEAASATAAGTPAQSLIPRVEAPDGIEIPELSPVDAAITPSVRQDGDASRAAEAASPEIQTAGPEVVAAPLQSGADPTSSAPKSIADKVLDAARVAVGDGGGPVDVASLRKALPDVAPKDLENALREIHADDSDHTLAQNPRGQRTGVDGVAVPGQGKFHSLDLAPRDPDAAQVGSAAPEAGADQPGSAAAAGGGDATGAEVARAGEVLGAEAGPSGAEVPADQRSAPAAVAPEVATRAKLAPQDPTVRSPEQTVQTAAKLRATSNILAAAPEAKAAADPVVKSLRRQTRNKTALVETPEGTQIPTDAVGGDATEIPQILASSVDPIPLADPAEPIAKVPFGRVAGIVDTAPVVPREQLDAHVAKFTAKLRPELASKIRVIDSEEGFPADVRAAMARNGQDMNHVSAIYHKPSGEVFIRADQMRNLGEVEDTLSHEVFGHLATAKRFAGASDYQTAMAKIFDKIGGGDGIEAKARELGVWDENEDGNKLQGGAGLRHYLPPDRANMTPLQKTRALDELIAHRAAAEPSAMDAAISAIQDMARKGIVNTLRRAGMANFAKRLDTFTQADLSKWVADSRKALSQAPRPGDIDLLAGSSDPRMFIHDVEPTGEPPFLARMSGQQRDIQGVMGLVGSALDHLRSNIVYKDLFGPKVPKDDASVPAAERLRAVRNTFLEEIAPGRGIAEEGKIAGMGGLLDYYRTASGPRSIIETRVKDLNNGPTQALTNLKVTAPDHEKLLSTLMETATRNKLDPELPFDQHSWLARDNTPEQVEALKGVHAKLVADFQKLGQPAKGGVKTNAQQIYRDQLAVNNFNWYMGHAQALHADLTITHGLTPDYSPAQRFTGLEDGVDPKTAEALHTNIPAALAFAKQSYADMMAAAQTHLNGKGTEPGNVGSRAFVDLADTLKQNAAAEQVQLGEGPYFRLGSRGEYVVSGKILGVPDAKGVVTNEADPAAIAAIQAHVNEHFPQVSVGLSTNNRSYFARFTSQTAANDFANLFQDRGPLRKYIDEEHGTRARLMSDSQHGLDAALPALQSHIDQASALYDRDIQRLPDGPSKDALVAARDKYVGNLRASLINLRGDTSMSSILARRQNVQGSSTNMARNQQEAGASYARDIAFTATRKDMSDGLAQARDAINDAATSGQQNALNKQARMQRIYDAFEGRNTAANQRVDNTFLSWTKRFMHPFQLAMSPAYIAMNTGQLGTLTGPELAKFHGYGRTAAAMTAAILPAGRVIASMVRNKGIFEGGLTKDVMDGARLSPELRDFTSTMANHGHLELGSFTSNQSGLSYGNMGRVQRFLHFANSTALLTETYTRLVAAYAAKDLHDNIPEGSAKQSMLRQFPKPEDYAGHVVSDTMMEWGNANTPKFMTPGATLGGKAAPAIFQFHGWTPRIMEKVYREAANGYTSRLGEGPEADAMRAEAKSFIKSHASMVGLLAGGLGLPFVNTALGVGTKLSGLVQDQPTDLEAGLRTFLADSFGKDMGEVLSRGLPRYMGVDMADQGDNNFIPFSRLLEDRRPLEDAIPDYAAHAWGSSVGMATNAALAVREMSEGRFSEAGARSLPTVMRNVVRAYRADQYGFVNKAGERLPGVSNDAAAIAKTALGFEGGDLAEERERQQVAGGVRTDRQYSSGLIKRDYTLATIKGDQAGVQQALDAARKFDQDNPGQRLVAQIAGLAAARAKAEAYGRMTGTLGVNPMDRVTTQRTNF